MDRLPTFTLATSTPCCTAPVRLKVVNDVPREVYDRQCAKCGQKWQVERRRARSTYTALVDILDWTIRPEDR